MARTAPLGLIGLFLTAASLLLLWFIILSAVATSTPLDKTYFLRADTSGITGARSVSQWNYFYVCGAGNTDCGGASAAYPFGRAWDSNAEEVPGALDGGNGGNTTSFKFYYLWRFCWVFFILTLFFETVAFFTGFLACCGRLGAAISGAVSLLALLFSTLAVVLMTVTFVQARDAFESAGRSASIGRYAFGFAWASWTLLLFACILFCLGIRKSKSDSSGGVTSRSRFRRNKSVRSHNGSRVKDDYS